MKKIALFAVCLFWGCASVPFENWTKDDTTRQVVYGTLLVWDCAQTVEISQSNGRYFEDGIAANFIGTNPSPEMVYGYFAATAIVQTAIPAMLKPKYRKIAQHFFIQTEASYVGHNITVGLTGSF